MRHYLYGIVGLAICAAVIALPTRASAQTGALPSQQNNAGQVMVKVTPRAVSKTANAWRFEVQFNTHVAPITQNLVAVTTLSDGNGHDEHPLAWDGDPPGGHHRKGTLVFKPIDPLPQSLTLTIRQVGAVPERSFTWKLTGRD